MARIGAEKEIWEKILLKEFQEAERWGTVGQLDQCPNEYLGCHPFHIAEAAAGDPKVNWKRIQLFAGNENREKKFTKKKK